ncbi:hypothetical protein HDA32_005982 [Spinactinospora alkalitolerans]|uniref:Uncharacterized protein n=1 Tax=Spinactinospora alkalitolerans TaxID=687207 RepID=A0A852U5T2_9ACTN|nr:hypothetical protein [Spinactinospora alkalitolerans]NYE50862.1 hypothetical protein [Spinactinospora alkalitolerans]
MNPVRVARGVWIHPGPGEAAETRGGEPVHHLVTTSETPGRGFLLGRVGRRSAAESASGRPRWYGAVPGRTGPDHATMRDAAGWVADDGTLERLNREYPNWRVWRSRDDRGRSAAWVATNRTPGSPWAPTLHGDDAGLLEAQLQDPPPAYGRPLAPLKPGE